MQYVLGVVMICMSIFGIAHCRLNDTLINSNYDSPRLKFWSIPKIDIYKLL